LAQTNDDGPASSGEALPVKTVQCSCGYVASGETANELLDDVEAHIAAEHRVLSQPSDEHAQTTTTEEK
jgi:predicted small metal-binding protein